MNKALSTLWDNIKKLIYICGISEGKKRKINAKNLS